ncbi:MAG: FAD-binding oxidoreductase [Actinomycetota bacterium]|nr:FAD-binding oxidoreductase [Actinomycetota bacterium]
MPVDPTSTAVAPRATLSGWGRTAPTVAVLVRPRSAQEVSALLAQRPERGLIGRGLGRSYGDAAQNAGGVVLDCTGLAPSRIIDATTGIVTAAAGISLDGLMRELLPLGWFVPVTPGTRYVTVGGAIAADIHGKNHHVDGSFGNAVTALTLVTPGGQTRKITSERNPKLFWATIGGMGLTGVVVDATFRCIPVETSRIRVDTERAENLDDALDRMTRSDEAYRYTVAWIDLLAQGSSLGRSVLTRGDHATRGELEPRQRSGALAFDPKVRLAAPPWVPPGLLNRFTVRAFNEMWFHKAPVERRGEIQGLTAFFHPLDGMAGWNRLYGPRGLVQYQFVVPFGAEDVLRHVVERIARSGCASFLAVLKRFGEGNPAPLSFPIPGWTLALDLPVGDETLPRLLAELDEQVVCAGGRVYLAKDSVLSADLLPRMYPRLEEWRGVRHSVDPEGVMTSDLARRLGL